MGLRCRRAVPESVTSRSDPPTPRGFACVQVSSPAPWRFWELLAELTGGGGGSRPNLTLGRQPLSAGHGKPGTESSGNKDERGKAGSGKPDLRLNLGVPGVAGREGSGTDVGCRAICIEATHNGLEIWHRIRPADDRDRWDQDEPRHLHLKVAICIERPLTARDHPRRPAPRNASQH